MSRTRPALNPLGGFTLVELAVMIIVISVLAAFAVPRFRDSAERAKATEAFSYLSSVRAAQDRFAARHDRYTSELDALEVEMALPPHFVAGKIEGGHTGSLEDSWSLTLTRVGSSAGYGNYTVTFTDDGFDVDRSSIITLTAINPMQT